MNRSGIKRIAVYTALASLLSLFACAGNSNQRNSGLVLTRGTVVSPDKFVFPVGYYPFHEEQLYNFNLNRWHSLGFARYQDMREAGRRIHDFEDWTRVMSSLAQRAEREGRPVNAAAYYRAAEFFMQREDPRKEILYDKFISIFYRTFAGDGIEKHRIPFGKSYLPAIRVPAKGEKQKGVVVVHGGFDSFIEELYPIMKTIANHGYEVIAFEGPGQGTAVKKYGHYFDLRWERPTGAVLDYFKLEDVTLIGISLGGYLCLRAAAFEPRVQRVVAMSVAYDHGEIPGFFERQLVKVLFRFFRDFTNRSVKGQMKENPVLAWSIGNMMYIANKSEPIEALDVMLSLNAENLHSAKIKQDVLILSGAEDHLVPIKMHSRQVEALIHARSVTERIFTRAEQGQNHCQVGNIGLALETILNWLDKKSNQG